MQSEKPLVTAHFFWGTEEFEAIILPRDQSVIFKYHMDINDYKPRHEGWVPRPEAWGVRGTQGRELRSTGWRCCLEKEGHPVSQVVSRTGYLSNTATVQFKSSSQCTDCSAVPCSHQEQQVKKVAHLSTAFLKHTASSLTSSCPVRRVHSEAFCSHLWLTTAHTSEGFPVKHWRRTSSN